MPVRHNASRKPGKANRAASRMEGAPNDACAFVEAVFARHDPADVTCDLLSSKDDRIKERVWEKLLEYRFGKSPQTAEPASGGPAVRWLWDIPAGSNAEAPETE